MKLLLIPLALVVAIVAAVSIRFTMDKRIPYEVATDTVEIPSFEASYLDFEQALNDAESLPFTAGAVIDIDNDGVEELYVGGGPDQDDAVFRFVDGRFQRLPADTVKKPEMRDASFGATVIDTDANGFSDLIVARTSGVWLYLNQGGRFSGRKLGVDMGADTSPLQVAVSDINRDGHFDMYVSGYIRKELVEGQNIFNKEGYGGTSRMFLNNGDDSFTDITESSGLYYKHNTFMGIFVDIDNDGLEDLVVAHDTGQVRTWKNLGDLKFRNMPNPNSDQYSYPMGIAVTDYENDGLVDFFFSNVGTTPPRFLVTGDLREDQFFNPDWILFKNQGDFRFVDIAEDVKIAGYEFSWGAIFEDFNLDGRDDLVVSENYIGFPPHRIPLFRLPGRFLLQTASGEFAETGEQSGVVNTGFSISPLTADFNNDGYPDIVHVNIAGRPKAFINKGGDSNYLKVKLPDTVRSVAAKITVTLTDGTTLHRDWVSGEGLCSDQSHVQIFGLGDRRASEVTVRYINGERASKTGDFANTLLRFE